MSDPPMAASSKVSVANEATCNIYGMCYTDTGKQDSVSVYFMYYIIQAR